MKSPAERNNRSVFASAKMLDECSGLVDRCVATMRALSPIAERVLDKHLPRPPAAVLDLGGGAGRTTVPLVP